MPVAIPARHRARVPLRQSESLATATAKPPSGEVLSRGAARRAGARATQRAPGGASRAGCRMCAGHARRHCISPCTSSARSMTTARRMALELVTPIADRTAAFDVVLDRLGAFPATRESRACSGSARRAMSLRSPRSPLECRDACSQRRLRGRTTGDTTRTARSADRERHGATTARVAWGPPRRPATRSNARFTARATRALSSHAPRLVAPCTPNSSVAAVRRP